MLKEEKIKKTNTYLQVLAILQDVKSSAEEAATKAMEYCQKVAEELDAPVLAEQRWLEDANRRRIELEALGLTIGTIQTSKGIRKETEAAIATVMEILK